MSIIDSSRRQEAVYWPPCGADHFGRPTYGPAVFLCRVANYNGHVRWEDKAEQFRAADGTTQVSSAEVMVPRLPDGSEIQVGGFLWLGAADDLTDIHTPMNNPGAHEIRAFNKTPDLKARKFLRVAII